MQTTGGDPDSDVGRREPIDLHGARSKALGPRMRRSASTESIMSSAASRRRGRAGRASSASSSSRRMWPTAAGSRRRIASARRGDSDLEHHPQFHDGTPRHRTDRVPLGQHLQPHATTSDSALVLDTMLGSNDGAPLRVEESAIISDTAFSGDQIPDFWQAFDSLSDPRVTAQGTLRGDDVTPLIVSISATGALWPTGCGSSISAGPGFHAPRRI